MFRAKLQAETDPDKVKMMEGIAAKVAAAQDKEGSTNVKVINLYLLSLRVGALFSGAVRGVLADLNML